MDFFNPNKFKVGKKYYSEKLILVGKIIEENFTAKK